MDVQLVNLKKDRLNVMIVYQTLLEILLIKHAKLKLHVIVLDIYKLYNQLVNKNVYLVNQNVRHVV